VSYFQASEAPSIRLSFPAELPVRVRLSRWSYLLRHRRSDLGLSVVIGLGLLAGGVWLVTSPDQTVHSERYGDMDGHLVGWLSVAISLFLLIYSPVSAARLLGDGVVLGADRDGVYLRPNLVKGRVLFLPWAQVEQVSVRRWHGPQLVVRPRDPRLNKEFEIVRRGSASVQAGAAIAQSRRMKRLGTNLHAPIGGHDPAEILSALRYQAAGRAPVDME
jgi:hypothetical protein